MKYATIAVDAQLSRIADGLGEDRIEAPYLLATAKEAKALAEAASTDPDRPELCCVAIGTCGVLVTDGVIAVRWRDGEADNVAPTALAHREVVAAAARAVATEVQFVALPIRQGDPVLVYRDGDLFEPIVARFGALGVDGMKLSNYPDVDRVFRNTALDQLAAKLAAAAFDDPDELAVGFAAERLGDVSKIAKAFGVRALRAEFAGGAAATRWSDPDGADGADDGRGHLEVMLSPYQVRRSRRASVSVTIRSGEAGAAL